MKFMCTFFLQAGFQGANSTHGFVTCCIRASTMPSMGLDVVRLNYGSGIGLITQVWDQT